MYSFKKNKFKIYTAALALASAAFFHACNSQSERKQAEDQQYVNLPEYFNNEISRLNGLKPTILKTVVKDSISESKKVRVTDWERELSSFTNIDLNKPAYQGLFEKDSSDHRATYISNDPQIDIQQVTVDYEPDGTPFSFLIKRKVDNTLYETSEILSYNKKEGYSIEKKQHILLLGDKFYFIKGVYGGE